MSGIGQGITILKDVGYRVILRNEDDSPRLVWRCFVKEGQYGKFISIEQHWVRQMESDKIIESDFGRKRFTFPYDKEKAIAMRDSIVGLLEEALQTSDDTDLEKEVDEEISTEFEGVDDES
jgi:hypothetical protein